MQARLARAFPLPVNTPAFMTDVSDRIELFQLLRSAAESVLKDESFRSALKISATFNSIDLTKSENSLETTKKNHF